MRPRKTIVTSRTSPRPVGPYSPAVRAGSLLFISGQIPIDAATSAVVKGDVAVQTRCVLEHVRDLLAAAGLSFDAVVRTTVYLADLEDFQAVNAVYAEYFTEPYPARSTVQAARLPRDVRVEIDAIASCDMATDPGA